MTLPPEIVEILSDRFKRLNFLYYITNKDGKPVRFRMKREQLEYYEGMHTRNIILKARQIGFTTQQCIMQLDAALFDAAKCALIAHNKEDAQRLFREKTKFAYENLPNFIKQANPAKNDAVGQLVFAKGGSLYVSNSFRGGTLRYLHISEFGKICAKTPDKATEIVTGAFEAVSKESFITIESTAEGRSGYFYDYCQTSEQAKILGSKLSSLDWKFFFYSWFTDADYVLDEPDYQIPLRLRDYFQELKDKHGIETTHAQQAWYASKEKTLGDKIKQEYPSTPEEAFQQSVLGAYYAKQFQKIYADGRICEVPDNSHLPVMTFWDIGVSDSTAIWFVRKVGEQYHVIDYYENSGEGLRHYMKVLKDKGYTYSEHWAPHDIRNREFGADAKSRLDTAAEGYEIDGQHYYINFDVVPQTGIATGIEAVREILPHCVFDQLNCEQGINKLEAYRKEWDDKRGCWKDRPYHDENSHGADSFRMFAVSQNNRNQVGMAFFKRAR